MDSLTQIVLGAACGEAVMGRKIGNKALLLGAIGGTIPDLDIIIARALYDSELDKMLFHRGFMHSILFSILGAIVLSYLFHFLNKKWFPKSELNLKNWFWMWFLSLFTHIILDSFTGYGTQLFLPFSNERIAFNNISVVDLFYTLPFLFCLIVLMFFNRKSKKRRILIRAAFIVSCTYLIFTFVNQYYINSIFKDSLKSHNIEFTRYNAQPVLLTNFLWFITAETNDDYYTGFYSLFDEEKKVKEFTKIPKNKTLRKSLNNNRDFEQLAWASNDYYYLMKGKNGEFKYNDLRYPLVDEKDYTKGGVFGIIFNVEGNQLELLPFEPDVDEENPTKIISDIYERIKGI